MPWWKLLSSHRQSLCTATYVWRKVHVCIHGNIVALQNSGPACHGLSRLSDLTALSVFVSSVFVALWLGKRIVLSLWITDTILSLPAVLCNNVPVQFSVICPVLLCCLSRSLIFSWPRPPIDSWSAASITILCFCVCGYNTQFSLEKSTFYVGEIANF